MDRHRGTRGGDRYGGDTHDDYSNNSNQDSYHSRRPSRFSDGPPPSRFSDGPRPSRFSDGPPPSRFSDGPPPSRFSDGPPPSRFPDGTPPSRFSDGPPPSRFSDGPPPSRFSDGPPPSRFSDGPPSRFSDNGSKNNDSYSLSRRSPGNYRGGGGGGQRPFESPPRSGGFRPVGGGGGGVGGFRPVGGGSGGGYQAPLPPPPQSLSGQKRSFSNRGGSPDRRDGGADGGGGSFAKLFVGSVPRTVTELDIRPVFEEHGNVIEVALIKDKRTGQQQGCCFIKYATSADADRAIRALHNQYTLPGGAGPIQVRYADGEKERLGAVEYKLFIGSLNKEATEKEVEEIFLPYGRVEDVYLMRDEMRQSRGCGFVKYSNKDMALAAINALNGVYTMRGCDQPLTVRFADPKRPRPGDSRNVPAFGGPGFGPRFQAPGPRPVPNLGDPMGDQIPPNAWHPMSPQNMGPSSNASARGFGGPLPPRSGDLSLPSNQSGPISGPTDGAPSGPGVPSAVPQNFNQHMQPFPPHGQQISPMQKPLQSPQHLPPPLPLHSQVATSYSQPQASNASQLQAPPATGQPPYGQAPSSQHSQHFPGLSGQFSTSQPQLQQGAPPPAALQGPLNINLQSHSMPPGTNQQQMPALAHQQLLQPTQQSSQLAQMLSQQTQNLQATFQSSQQAISQLQQQLQMIQPSNQNLALQQNPQAVKQQWPGSAQPPFASSTTTLPADVPPSSVTAPTASVVPQTVATVKSNWTEHTSPEGFKYYYNSVTRESRWEKPEELAAFEQQQQVQKSSVQQPKTQPNLQVPPTQQLPQAQQQMQLQPQLQQQFRQHQHMQQPSFSSSFPAPGVRVPQDTQEHGYGQIPTSASSVNDQMRFQGLNAATEWSWKNKPTGA